MTVPGASAPTALPDAATFASTMGQAIWLMTVSKAHRDLPIREIEARVTPAIVLQQFKLYMKDKQPVAFVRGPLFRTRWNLAWIGAVRHCLPKNGEAARIS